MKLRFAISPFLGVAIAACGGTATAPPDNATQPPGGGVPATSDAGPGSGGTNSGFEVPPIADGVFESGTLQFGITGEYSAGEELPLDEGLASGGVTRLAFGQDPIAVVISYFEGSNLTSFVITTGDFFTGGQSGDGLCSWEITRNDESALEGSISCATTGTQGDAVEDPKDIQITLAFMATR